MSKTITRSILVISIAIVSFAIIWVMYDMVKKEPANANVVDKDLPDENTGLDNVINELFENIVEENEIVNDVENKVNEDDEEDEDEETSSETVTSKEKRAVELVKEFWGEDDSVYFSYQSIDNKGRYIVSVNRKDSSVIAWYTVDVDSEIVTKM